MNFSAKFIWTFLSNIFYAASQFFILSIIAKIGGPEEVGVFTYALAISSPFFLFLNVKLRSIVLTDVENQNRIEQFILLRNVTNWIAVILVILIAIIFRVNSYQFIAIIFFCLSKVFEMKIDIFYAFYQKNNRYDIVGKSTFLRGGISFFLAAIFYYFFEDIISVMISFLISNAIIYYFYDYPNVRRIESIERITILSKENRKKIFSIFIIALPLGVSTIIGSLNTNFPRYLIEAKLGIYELGIFSGLVYILIIGNTFLTAISQIVTPKLAKFSNENDFKSFISLLIKIQIFGLLLSSMFIVIFSIANKQIINLLFSSEYTDYSNVLMILIYGMVFLYSSVFFGTGITSLKLFKIQPIIHLIGLITTIISSLALIESMGLEGMAISLLLNYIVISICYIVTIIYVLSRKIRKINHVAHVKEV